MGERAAEGRELTAEQALAQLAWTGCDPEVGELRWAARLEQLRRRVAAVPPAWAEQVQRVARAHGEDRRFPELWAALRGEAPPVAAPSQDELWRQSASWPLSTLLERLPQLHRLGIMADRQRVEQLRERLQAPSAEGERGPLRWLAARRAGEKLPEKLQATLAARAESEADALGLPGGAMAVLLDVSGAMRASAPGQPGPASTRRSVLEDAAEVAVSLLRARRDAWLVPHAGGVVEPPWPLPGQTLPQAAAQLCALSFRRSPAPRPLSALLERGAQPSWVIAVGEQNDTIEFGSDAQPGPLQLEWDRLRTQCPSARLVLINVHPSAEPPPLQRTDVLRVHGVGDALFAWIDAFARERLPSACYAARVLEG